MNSIEEKLWEYIDGTCTAAEKEAISAEIATNEACREKYEELLSLSNELALMEVEEPSMAFTYNVMETIRNEQARQPLKAGIDRRIIMGLAAFFVFTITAFVVYVMLNINWTSQSTGPVLPVNLRMPDIKSLITSPLINGFLFFDVILGLFLFDNWLRRRNASSHRVV